MVTSTNDNCLGTDCPFWGDCFVVQARQRAQSADIVVVNHHLLLADLALKQEGFGEILPGAQAFVIDEAHQLPELAANFFGESFGMRPMQELARDCLAECKDVPGALAACRCRCARWNRPLRELRAGMEGLPTRGTRFRALAKPEVGRGFDALTECAGASDRGGGRHGRCLAGPGCLRLARQGCGHAAGSAGWKTAAPRAKARWWIRKTARRCPPATCSGTN